MEKENQLMKTASAIARYLAGVIFLVFGLNGFLNFLLAGVQKLEVGNNGF